MWGCSCPTRCSNGKKLLHITFGGCMRMKPPKTVKNISLIFFYFKTHTRNNTHTPRKQNTNIRVYNSGAYGIDKRQALVLSYSGLRGAVGLTLAIAIHQDEGIAYATRDRCGFCLLCSYVCVIVYVHAKQHQWWLRANVTYIHIPHLPPSHQPPPTTASSSTPRACPFSPCSSTAPLSGPSSPS